LERQLLNTDSSRDRDYSILLITRLLRAFAFGLCAVLIGVHLELRGLTPEEIGAAITIGLLAAALTGLGFARLSVQIGRRNALSAAGLLMAVSGIDLAFAASVWLLLAAGVTGMLGAASNDLGPHNAVETAVLAESVTPERRNRAFAQYSLTGGLASAAGGLVAGLGTDVARSEVVFVIYALLGLVTGLLPQLLSKRVEGDAAAIIQSWAPVRPLLRITGLFALDSLGGGLVANAVLVFWLHARFHVGPEVLGPAFSVITVLGAVSNVGAAWLGNRIGLVRTMVVTHFPSSLLLAAVAFVPTLPWALALLVLRSTISQMDVPARQAYIVSIVKPSERAGAIAITGAARGIALSVGPSLSGLAIQSGLFGLPFIAASLLKVTYDVGLYRGFHDRPAEHELAMRRVKR
jgi:MFS family permease